MFRTRLLCTLIALTITGPLSGVDAQDAATKRQSPVAPLINKSMEPFIAQRMAAGVVTLVAHDGKIKHLGAIGQRNLETGKEMTPGTLFSIASMTKPITATALMILQDEGKLDLNDPLSKYLPAFADAKLESGEAVNRPLTIRDAITHTAGLKGDQLFTGTLADAVDELGTRPLAFQPGTKWQYSPGLNVAGRIVEIVADQPFEDFVQERILAPLKMNNTTFYPNQAQRKRVAAIYAPTEDETALVAVPNRITDLTDANGPNPSGGLVSNARDLFRFYQMILNGGELQGQRVLSTAAVELMTSPQTGDLETGFTPGNCWGLGWCIINEPQGVTEMLSPGSFGHGGAFGTQGWIDPTTKTIYVLLIQRTKFGNSDGSEIRKTFQQSANEALGI